MPLVLRLAGIWVIYACWCQVAGWILSLMGHLHLAGYLLALPVLLAATAAFWKSTGPYARPLALHPWFRRLKNSPAFAAWCVVCLLIFLGGTINPPSNYDGISYRMPKLLYWLQENRWHWIDGIDYRLNITGSGFEWLSAPIILFTRSDRPLFLLNFLPFLLLPGLFFIGARVLGIRAATARWWMWVWPMAYGVAMQAGSIGNDYTGGVLALTSLAFAAQARKGRPLLCLFLSALAASAMTAIKVSMLPLGLPLAIYWLWTAWQLLGPRRAVILGTATLPLAALCSFLPVAFLCWHYSGAWNGNPDNRYGLELKNPIAGIVGNGIEFTIGAIYPPVYPSFIPVARQPLGDVREQTWFRWINESYPVANVTLGHELPSEETAGIGLGITLLLGVWYLKGRRRRLAVRPLLDKPGIWFAVGTAVAALAFMAKQGIGGTPRLMVAYIPFIILSALVIHQHFLRLRRLPPTWLSLLPAVFILPALFINPNRPLIPPSTLLALPGLPQTVKTRMSDVYSAYASRGNLLAPFRQMIPAGDLIGFAGGPDHSALALFRPLGSVRGAINLSPRTISSVDWVLATKYGFEKRLGMPLTEWEKSSGFEKVTQMEITSKVKFGGETWTLYRRSQR